MELELERAYVRGEDLYKELSRISFWLAGSSADKYDTGETKTQQKIENRDQSDE